MAQHFLLTPACRTLSETKVARMSEEEARNVFRMLRWTDTEGEAVCPRCGCDTCYSLTSRKKWRCKACTYDFSVTSGTIFADRKMAFRDILLTIFKFVNSVKGLSALQLSREIGCDYKVAFVMLHKLRECMETEMADCKMGGENEVVEVDGAYFGGTIRKENKKEDRKDRRLVENQNGKRRVVGVIRQRNGRTLTTILPDESALIPVINNRVLKGTVIHADEAAAYDILHARYDVKRINHQQAYSLNGACTNNAESFFSRLRRAELGIHHRISGKHLHGYAAEMAWREDHRRQDNATLTHNVASLSMAHSLSTQWRAYGSRSKAARRAAIQH